MPPPLPTPIVVWSVSDIRGTLPTRAGGPAYTTRPLSGITGITIHYTASSPYATVRGIAAYQVGPTAQEAFPAIAYTLMVDYRGVVSLCHSLETRVWHSGAVVGGVARNASHVGVCWIGDTEPNAAQIRGLGEAISYVQHTLGRKLAVEGHRDAPYPTTCPGPTWPSWRSLVLAGVR